MIEEVVVFTGWKTAAGHRLNLESAVLQTLGISSGS